MGFCFTLETGVSSYYPVLKLRSRPWSYPHNLRQLRAVLSCRVRLPAGIDSGTADSSLGYLVTPSRAENPVQSCADGLNHPCW